MAPRLYWEMMTFHIDRSQQEHWRSLPPTCWSHVQIVHLGWNHLSSVAIDTSRWGTYELPCTRIVSRFQIRMSSLFYSATVSCGYRSTSAKNRLTGPGDNLALQRAFPRIRALHESSYTEESGGGARIALTYWHRRWEIIVEFQMSHRSMRGDSWHYESIQLSVL